jgi:hypothetical protein
VRSAPGEPGDDAARLVDERDPTRLLAPTQLVAEDADPRRTARPQEDRGTRRPNGRGPV